MIGRPSRERKGAAFVELALFLPLLMFILVASTDFARAYRDLAVVTDRARNAALYASQNVETRTVPRAPMPDLDWQNGIKAAANADASALSSTSQVTISPANLSAVPVSDPYVTITVSNPFQTVMVYPGIPSQMTLSRTFRVRLQPTSYRMK